MLAIEIKSDIHLEFRSHHYCPDIKPRAPHIALLGDIGRPHSTNYGTYIHKLSKAYQTVIIVAGNHEYFGNEKPRKTIAEVEQRLREYASTYENVVYLQNDSLILKGVRIIGATLWAHIPDDVVDTISSKLHDFRLCYTAPKTRLCAKDTNAFHRESVRYIEALLECDRTTPTIVLTHHAPSFRKTGNPKYMGDLMQTTYCSDLEHLFKRPVVAWAFGHTHWPTDFVHEPSGVRIVSNPTGYNNADENFGSIKNPVIRVFGTGVPAVSTPRTIHDLPDQGHVDE